MALWWPLQCPDGTVPPARDAARRIPEATAIIGVPVGFIGAAESKQALVAFADEHGIDIPYLTVRGRRGGSAIAASALNALAQEAE